jgi:sigma-E factor negative regulatory protein RseB
MLIPVFIRRFICTSAVTLIPFAISFSSVAFAQEPAQSGHSLAASQSPEVANLLRKMATIPQTLNYQGSFTYQHKDNPALQSFRIIHWVEEGVEHERLQHLNGPEREVLRTGKAIGCESLGDQLLQGKISQLGANLARLDQLYKFEVRGGRARRDGVIGLAVGSVSLQFFIDH